MPDDQKLARYEYTLHTLEELLKCELEDMVEDWSTSPYNIYKRARANTYKEVLFNLTGDNKWWNDLEKLGDLLKLEGEQ